MSIKRYESMARLISKANRSNYPVHTIQSLFGTFANLIVLISMLMKILRFYTH